MRTFAILYKNRKINIVAILPHKGTELYSYVNLTKGHICPCKFESVEAAIEDLNNYDEIEMWEELNENL